MPLTKVSYAMIEGATVNVLDFGAVGDGVTDDTAAIQAAIDSLTTGGVVYLPTGVYKVNSTVTLKSNVQLKGDGYSSQILIGVAGINAITLATSSVNTEIDGLRITGTDPVTNADEKAIYGVTPSYFTIQNCYIEKVNYGIKPDGGIQGKIINNTFFDTAVSTTQGTAVLLGDDASHIVVDGNTFKQIARHAVYLSTGTQYTSVANNVIDGCLEAAINFNSDDTDNPNIFNSIVGNTISNCTRSGIYLLNYCQNNTISANTINTTGEYGIRLEGNSTYALDKVPNFNVISNNNIANTTLTSINLNNANDNTVSNNNVNSSLATGIALSISGAGIGSFNYRNNISNNKITNCSRGLSIAGASVNTQLDNNYLYNNTLNNYYLTGGTGTIFSEVFLKDYADYSTVGTGADTLATTTIPAYYLGASGGLKIKAAGTKTGSAGNKTIQINWNGTLFTVNPAANNTNTWYAEAEIVNTSLSTQRVSWRGWDGATVTQEYTTAAEGTIADRTLSLLGTCANGADLITQTMFLVERF